MPLRGILWEEWEAQHCETVGFRTQRISCVTLEKRLTSLSLSWLI